MKRLTPEEFLLTELKMGMSLDNKAFLTLADKTIEQLEYLNCKTILDYGAGIGAYSLASINKGFDTFSYEIWDEHNKYMSDRIKGIKLINKPIETDIMLLIEVAEHMTDDEINELFYYIKPKNILFSSTSETTSFDSAWGHINIKPQEQWIQLFNNFGYKLEKELPYPTSWAKLFKYDITIRNH